MGLVGVGLVQQCSGVQAQWLSFPCPPYGQAGDLGAGGTEHSGNSRRPLALRSTAEARGCSPLRLCHLPPAHWPRAPCSCAPA
eukprot:360398-Chlamydomonas_euryale.AAC.2